MAEELKPCPFCGGEARSQEGGTYKAPFWEIVCDECDFCGPARSRADSAAAAWNTRTPDPELTTLRARVKDLEEGLKADQVEWVVNDNAELGVKIGDQFFFLYKGGSLVYDGAHDDGRPMLWRHVYKREFGECCHPVNYSDPSRIGTVSVTDGAEWRPIAKPRTLLKGSAS